MPGPRDRAVVPELQTTLADISLKVATMYSAQDRDRSSNIGTSKGLFGQRIRHSRAEH